MKKNSFLICLFFISFFVFGQTENDFNYVVVGSGSAQRIQITGYKGTADHVVIPSMINGIQVHSIGPYSFAGDRDIVSVTISSGIIIIATNAFYHCINLKNIVFPDTLIIIGDGAFSNCRNLTDVQFPDSLTHIGEYAFWDCFELKQFNYPRDLEQIGTLAFGGITNLHNNLDINILNTIISKFGSYIFADER